MESDLELLRVETLRLQFNLKRKYTVNAVEDVSFKIRYGETYGLVGESGSGKSTIGRTLIRLYNPASGRIIFKGHDISGRMDKQTSHLLRTNMQMIFQDPSGCLNPRRKVLDIIAEGLDIHGLYSDNEERKEKVYRILNKVGLAKDHADRYPHQFSGGQKQRIGIARALIMDPDLIIADEAVSALDVSIQAQIVNLMKEMQKETHTAYLFISHDLSMVKYISDRIGVLHQGYLLEEGLTSEIFETPVHPYTKSLLSAIPQPDPLSERGRQVFSYDCSALGIDYSKGEKHWLTDTHYVLSTSDEIRKWAAASYTI